MRQMIKATGLMACGWAAFSTSATEVPRAESLLPEWRQFSHAPIMNYTWERNADGDQRAERLADTLAMGITGIYKAEKEAPHGGALFRALGLHGHMIQTFFANARERVLGPDGEPVEFRRRLHPWHHSIFSPNNRSTYERSVERHVRSYGLENLFHAGDTLVMSSWDETGLYSREAMEYGYDARERFIDFLKTDSVAALDGGSDDPAVLLAPFMQHPPESWDALQLPAFSDRYNQPGLWRLWSDFHGYATSKFFRDTGDVVGRELGLDLELFPFLHASAKWPGASSAKGLDWYWQTRMHRVITVEDCQADYPGSRIHYAFTDQLSRRYRMPVLGWSWFWPEPDRYNDPDEAARALARTFGHNTHGLLFWVYTPKWAQKPEMREAVAYWHKLYNAHWPFLRQAWVPKPQVAVLFPRMTGNTYKNWEYPKSDYGWTIQALMEAHVNFEVIADNQLEYEPEILNDYRVLICPTTTWSSQRVRDAIAAFVDAGGYVASNADSFLLDAATGENQIAFLKHVFGVEPQHKHKGLFLPTRDSLAEYAWAHAEAASWQSPVWEGEGKAPEGWNPEDVLTRFRPAQISDETIHALQTTLPETSGSGLPQQMADPRIPLWIEGTIEAVPSTHRTFHDLVTGEPVGEGVAVARFGDAVCAVETERTLWTGFRPGFDLACVFPIVEMTKWGEPVWPFDGVALTGRDPTRDSARHWVERIVRKAGITPELTVTLDGRHCPDIEVLIREQDNGDALIILISHHAPDGLYTLQGQRLADAESAANLMADAVLDVDPSGAGHVRIQSGNVILIAIGSESFVTARRVAHRLVPRETPPMPIID